MKIVDILARKNSENTQQPAATIVFFGDSVTQGSFELFEESESRLGGVNDYGAVYHARLQRMLHTIFPNAPVNCINAGIGGETAVQGKMRLERDVLRHAPDLVIVCFGLNDAGEGADKISDYEHALREIFSRLKQANIETIFMTPNMLNTDFDYSSIPAQVKSFAKHTAALQNTGVMDAYMNSALQICKQEKIAVCNCYQKWKLLQAAGVDTTKLLANRINHPIREMHALFAYSLFETIFFSANHSRKEQMK